MSIIPAKCPQCGANIEVDNTKDAGICKYCGTAFVTEKAINNYTTINNITNNYNISDSTVQAKNEILKTIIIYRYPSSIYARYSIYVYFYNYGEKIRPL